MPRAIAMASVSLFTLMAAAAEPPTGVLVNEPGAFDGYTLFTPLRSTTTYLIDMAGNVAHTWESEHTPGQSVYLLDNGNLLRCASPRGTRHFHGGGVGGLIEEFDWDAKIVWSYDFSDENHCQHHDIEPLPNGNILILAWEKKTADEAVAAGRDPGSLVSDELWPDHIVEVKPQGQDGAEIVWRWSVWDHLIQDFDDSKANYGVVADHPELIDVNYAARSRPIARRDMRRLRALGYVGGGDDEGEDDQPDRPGPGPGDGPGHGPGDGADWNHTNSIDYNSELDQIVLSVLNFNEIWIIDHSTTTAEAAGHTGGKHGKGGDLLYRWGNPQAYRAGDEEARRLYSQHDATWIPDGYPGAGRLLIFNNGRGRPDGDYSSADEIAVPVSREGDYQAARASAFLPKKAAWSYSGQPDHEFFSGHISGAQRLPNGNTLICAGEQGRIIEVTRKGEIVWDYVNPIKGKADLHGPPPGMRGDRRGPRRFPPPPPGGRRLPGGGTPRGQHNEQTALFRATRIAPGHPALTGRDLTPKPPVASQTP